MNNSNQLSEKEIEITTLSKDYIPNMPNVYDSEDTAIFLGLNTEKKTASFQNAATGKRYTLNYTGATYCLDRYDQNIAFTQMKTGTMSKIRFYKETKNLTYIKEETDCITFRECYNYDLNLNNATINLYGQLFKFNKNLTVMSEDKEITLNDIEDIDVISLWGYNDQIYSISVDKGHGFLTLSNDAYFIDGWVEVGEKVIKKITDGMKLVVPEGTYNVSVVKSGSSGSEQLTFERDKTVNWDLSFVEIVAPKTGKVIFTVTPMNARVYIDGEETDISFPVEQIYGIHQVTVVSKGYRTFSKYMKVGSAISNITIDLEKQDTANEDNEEKTDTKDDDKTEQESVENVEETTSNYKIHVDKPQGVEVYVDGNYIGIAPVEFAKKSGNIVITLRLDGHKTRSYALDVDEELNDTTYSFSELEKNE